MMTFHTIIDSKNVSYVDETKNNSLLNGAEPFHENQGFIICDGGNAINIYQNGNQYNTTVLSTIKTDNTIVEDSNFCDI